MFATELVTGWEFYWLTRLDMMRPLCSASCFFLVAAAVGLSGFKAIDESGMFESYPRVMKWLAIAFVVCGLMSVFLPSSSELKGMLFVSPVAEKN